MNLPNLQDLEQAAQVVYRHLGPTPQYAWPLLARALGAEVWVKHENHTPLGAFKVRGGLVYVDGLRRRLPQCRGLVGATRGNHGQSVGFAARSAGLSATIVVPHGNSREKNDAMQALGVHLVEHGHDFQAAAEHAAVLAGEQDLHFVPSFHPDLVAGVASYWVEFFRAVPDLELVYVPIGLGSGICACIAARAALGVRTRIVGVVSAQAPAYARSFAARHPVEAPVTTRIADGLACRVVAPAALEHICREVDEVVEVDDGLVESAMRMMFRATHNVVEGAGAAALAAALQQGPRGRKVGLVASGGNVDTEVFARVLAAADPQPEDRA